MSRQSRGRSCKEEEGKVCEVTYEAERLVLWKDRRQTEESGRSTVHKMVKGGRGRSCRTVSNIWFFLLKAMVLNGS